ncbi:MAG: hypothetical protein LBL39_02635, partial [Planctomycetaceae bacterium]|jgi:hypothetical protein|nr:hypothetical protein [Planctomycetaceae bacterium]
LPETKKEWDDALYYASTSAKHFSIQDFDNIINQLNNKGIDNMTPTTLDLVIERRLAEGEARIEARSKAEIARKFILDTLYKRFKMTSVPKKIKAAILQMNDPIALESLHCHALDCQTFEEFAEALT